MGTKYNPRIISSNIQIYYDAANTRSYIGSGTTLSNLISSSYSGTLQSGTAFSSSDNGSFYLDGVNDYISLTLPALTEWTFCFWINIKVAASSEIQFLSTNGDPTGLSMYSNVYNIWNGGSNNSTTNVITNTWHLLTFANSNSANQCKININNDITKTFISSNQIYSGAAQIGAINSTSRNLNANIATFICYDRYLSDSEIAQNYISLKNRYGI